MFRPRSFVTFLSGILLAVLGLMQSPAGAAEKPLAGLSSEESVCYRTLLHDLRERKRIASLASETYHEAALIHASDRDPADIVLRRTALLLADIRKMDGAPALGEHGKKLRRYQKIAKDTPLADKEKRVSLFKDAHKLRRSIAFANPLLRFDKLLFIKRHRSTFQHMCDQYYGAYTVPGGSLYVMTNPFGEKPKFRDILAGAVVQRGRLKGKELKGGSVISPDLSFDGKQIAFGYVECTGSKRHRHHLNHKEGHWDRGRVFHIFKINVDGTGLEQLTDGTFNDFDPCWLPNGRIAFISERRGGYLRCGRACPTYTVYDMAADGSDIRGLSYHETNEWHPSVMHDGMILFTRWDYVDRHGCTAHHPWTMTPDGRDPRGIHGNYSLRRKRPDMELDLRAIPKSRKIVGTAAPHHGQAWGSLVILDLSVKDDDKMAQVKRITPEVGFPESQGRLTEVYGQAWPLSEKYFLCSYEPGMQVRGLPGKGHYGLFLVDCFGNKIQIHRDMKIASQNPIPLRPRKRPPIIPAASKRVPEGKPAEATVGLINVYNSFLPLPKGAKIKALRIYQILPLPIASQKISHATGVQIPQGNDSINLARKILGTVPVEADGSAYFKVPARVEVYFQALDENGLAVQSMRSAALFQPGEKLICKGCHEPRYGAPPARAVTMKSLNRAPSTITPEMSGTNPFSYPLLVQPVLEKNCVSCHKKNPKTAPDLSRTLVKYPKRSSYMHPSTTYYASYVSLAPKFGFYNYGGKNWDDPKWYRTTPGEFGALGSKLYKMLKKGHHKLKLSKEDMRRITVWLDSCSLFYGVYEKEGGLLQLEGGIPKPTLE